MKKHSNLYHELGQGYRRDRVWSWIIAIVIIFYAVWLIYTIDMANARAATGYGIAVHKCIETYKAINQDSVRPLYPVGQCVNHPNTIQ